MLHQNSATFTLKTRLQQESFCFRPFLDSKTFYHFGIVTHKADLQSIRSRRNIFESKLAIEIGKYFLIDLN